MQTLPKEIIIMIIREFKLTELLKLSSTCKLFNGIATTTEWNIETDKMISLNQNAFKIYKFNYKKNSNRMIEICTTQTNTFKQIIKNISNFTSSCYFVFTSFGLQILYLSDIKITK
jgi:hypothetical protein